MLSDNVASLKSDISPQRVFRALTGMNLRPWQEQTLLEWVEKGPNAWGGICDVPTGLGKSMLPVLALIASAYVENPPRRFVFVVNRRIVVDQTYKTAKLVAERIRDPNSLAPEYRAIVIAFRDMLRSNMNLDDPLFADESKDMPLVHLLRGGTDDNLLQIGSPVVPTIIVSTIDQAGSRLLMRGYGVSRKAWPIQGGLLAYDTLWIVDEAHTAQPFVTTLNRVRRAIMESPNGAHVGRPLVVLEATATHPRGAAFCPKGKDERLIAEATKNVSFECLESTPKKGEFGKRASEFVKEALDNNDVARVAVISNTIAGAREAFVAITKALEKHTRSPECILLIGAIRKRERNILFASGILDNLDPNLSTPPHPIVVVATQTIETGPDFTFDWMLCELASLDALIQRFGRENRRGTAINPRGLIWGYPDRSPIYGDAPIATAKILSSWGICTQATAFSPSDLSTRLRSIANEDLSVAWAPTKLPEALYGARIRDLGRTWPQNREETDVAWYLHGERSGEIEIIWRPGIEKLLKGDIDREHLQEYVDALPPRSGEGLTVSTRTARALLRSNNKTDVSDTDDVDPQEGFSKNERRAIIVRDAVVVGCDESRRDRGGRQRRGTDAEPDSRTIRAGDILIVPATYGWYDEYGLCPGSNKPVVCDEVDENQRIFVTSDLPEIEDDELYGDWCERVIEHLTSMLVNSPDKQERQFSEYLTDAAQVSILPHPFDSARIIVRVTKRFGCNQDDDSGSRREILLEEHNLGVGERTRAYARALELSQEIGVDLGRSGDLHDLGKADVDFQQIQLGNTRFATQGLVLAKSKHGRASRHIRYRHECASAKMVIGEAPLVRHLVGTHHGYGRPGFPYYDHVRRHISFTQQGSEWGADSTQDLDALGGWWREQFSQLQQQWSPWGIAYLEALLRLADHRTSEAERKHRNQERYNAA